MNILVINGPNLNLLGERNPKIYGNETLEELMMWLENSTVGKNHQFKFYQSNHEGEIIDMLHDERDWSQGIILTLEHIVIILMPLEMLLKLSMFLQLTYI